MSVILGVYDQFGSRITEGFLRSLAAVTEVYAPDQTSVAVDGSIGMGFQAFHTGERSRLEHQPARHAEGSILVFDGRLDNYAELERALDLIDGPYSDSTIVLAAFARWGEDSFSRLIGDWALALWSLKDHSLFLARDHAGTRTLYYTTDSKGIVHWSTYLDTFLSTGRTFPLDEEYVAKYLSASPIGDITPYKGIRAVPPAHYLRIRRGSTTLTPHWEWVARDELRLKSNTEYERRFFELFRTSVERRSVGGGQLMAHLSGGMDSTSIVCMSDHIRWNKGNSSSTSPVKTISMYDDEEPDWDERPYFSIVEKKRGLEGFHIKVSLQDLTFEPPNASWGRMMFPCEDGGVARNYRTTRLLADNGARAILAGTGGDELLGGVPTPIPELANHMTAWNVRRTLERGVAWSLAKRNTLAGTLFDAAKFAIQIHCRPNSGLLKSPPNWMSNHLTRLYGKQVREVFGNYPRLGVRPSAMANGLAWWSILETLPHLYPQPNIRFEYRYPYTDRDLVDFLFRIPREQLVEPGRRRSLMRRALKETVPAEILERKRKAFCIRGPLLAIRAARERFAVKSAPFLCEEYGFVNLAELQAGMDALLKGEESRSLHSILATLTLEAWLQSRAG